VLLVDEVAPTPEANAPRLEAIAAALQASGADPASVRFLEKALDAESSHNASVAVGDAADECRADLLILHSDAVHAKRVDANLLAVSCCCCWCCWWWCCCWWWVGERREERREEKMKTHSFRFFPSPPKKKRFQEFVDCPLLLLP